MSVGTDTFRLSWILPVGCGASSEVSGPLHTSDPGTTPGQTCRTSSVVSDAARANAQQEHEPSAKASTMRRRQ